jgi:hypothetical protein
MQCCRTDQQVLERELNSYRLLLAFDAPGQPCDGERHWMHWHVTRQSLDELQPSLLLCLGFRTSVDAGKKRSTKQGCRDDLAGTDSNCCGGRREVNLLIVPFCSHAGKPNFPQMLEKNGGDDETRTRDFCRDSAAG